VSLWGNVFAAGYDRLMAGSEHAGLSRYREGLLARASGRVLEIGGGTGANLPFYGGRVTELVVSEPEEPMARRLERKLEGYRIPARVVRARAEQLPLDAGTFDCAVSTLVLCTVANPARALAEVQRLLKPDGELLFIEHVRSDDPKLARWQDGFRRPWGWLAHGCQTNRRTVDLLRGGGFALTDLRQTALPKAPAIVRPLAIGAAKARRSASETSS
jgi:ubiquinone/menaquinone biosynthesis C-methylase UbiE